MTLSQSKMQQIVEELHGTINKDINFMDKAGYIIASSDFTRIGFHHAGAQKIIDNNMDELIVGDNTGLEGARSGINLPICINHEIVGVVGITGDRKEVEPFGKIIKKMAEIMIEDENKKEQKHLIEITKNNFVYNWIYKSMNNEEEIDKFIASGKLLGIDVLLNRLVVMLSINYNDITFDGIEKQNVNDRIIRQIRDVIGADDIVVQIGERFIIFYHEASLDIVFKKVNKMVEEINKNFHVKIAGGIGSFGSNILEIRRSYKEAEMACNVMLNYKNKGIRIYGDVDLELLLHSIPSYYKSSFLNKIFKSYTKNEIENFLILFRTLIENNGSINKTADQLFQHKNTVQYRLNKARNIMGYDPRNMKDMVPIYVAMLIYENNRNELEVGEESVKKYDYT